MIAFILIYSISSFSQIDLSHLEDKNNTKQKDIRVVKSTQTPKGKSEISKKETKATKTQKKSNKDEKNKKDTKKQVKKTTKKKDTRERYVFKKEEQVFYKFDEKGNPILPRVKKSTPTPKNTHEELIIGVEEKNFTTQKGAR